jgi:hypothetical protein
MDKMRELSWSRIWLLGQTALVMVAVRLGLGFLPFAVVHRLFTGVGVRAGTHTALEQTTVAQVVWSVTVVGRRLPKVTCLVEAYTLHYLLIRQGLTTELRIGVQRGARKQLEAHAWVEHGGKVLIGDLPDLYQYKVLSAVKHLPA